MDWCLKVSGHQVIVTSYETSDQVEDIKPSNNKPRLMKIRFIYTIFCDQLQGFMYSFVVNMRTVYISFETNLVYFIK